MLKVLERSGIQGAYLNITKANYRKPIANIKLHGEKLEVIPLKSVTTQGCPLSPYLFNIALEVVARVVRQLKHVKGKQIGKEGVMVSPLKDITLYINKPPNLPENF